MGIKQFIGSFFGSGTNTFYGTQQMYIEAMKGRIGKVQAEKVSTVFNCCNILSDTLSRLPIILTDTEPELKPIKNDPRYYLLRHKVNNWLSSKKFISTLEFHRNTNGNAFARIHRHDYSGAVESFELLHPCWFTHYQFINGELYLRLDHSLNPDSDKTGTEELNYNELLHFAGVSKDGLWGLNPLEVANRSAQIAGKGETTIDNFYDNNAFSPMVMETKIETGMDPKATNAILESEKNFKDDHLGYGNKGKMIRLPWNKKLVPLSINMADAQIIETLKHTRDEIGNTYRIPNFMLSDSTTQKNIEEQTLYFKTFTIAPIVDIYQDELNNKLLTTKELIAGRIFEFDSNVLIEMDIKTLTTAVRMQITAGVSSLDEGIIKLKNKPVGGKIGKGHYVQQQTKMIEEYDEWKNMGKNGNQNSKQNNDGNKKE